MYFTFRPTFLKSTFDSIDSKKKLVFIKDMAFAMLPSRYQYLPDDSVGFKHLFLIRNPLKVYISFRKAVVEHTKDLPDEVFEGLGMQRPTEETFHFIDDTPEFKESSKYFFEASYKLWNHVKNNIDENVVILDIDDLLNDPSSMLPRLFEVLGIPYSESLLTWDQSSDVVMKWKSCCPNVRESPRYTRWFTRAFESSCFRKPGPEPSLADATKDVQEVVEREMPFYRELYNARLIV